MADLSPGQEARNDVFHEGPSWRAALKPFQKPVLSLSLWQLVTTVGGYILLWGVMYFLSRVSIWLAVPFAVLAGGFLVRIFIIFHDCTHNSFFGSSRANSFWGFVTGVFCFTPYHHWKWEHAIHHAHSGNLDARGLGEVWTFTVDEYLQAPLLTRLRYRIVRNPIVLFVVAPTILFLILHRIPSRGASARARRSVHLTTLAAIVVGLGVSFYFGWQAYVVIQFVTIFVAASAGVWLFYVQHQFEGVEWKRDEDWNFAEAAMRGSSFYRLPKVLQWFTGNIGFHHLHHLCPQIPNYHLPECNEAHAVFRAVPEVTLRASFKSFRLRLWDEQEKKLVCYGRLKERRQELRAILENNLVS